MGIEIIPRAIGGSFATGFLATLLVGVFLAGMLDDDWPALPLTDESTALRLPSSLASICAAALLSDTFLTASRVRGRDVS